MKKDALRKGFLCALLAMLMCIGMAASAFAAEALEIDVTSTPASISRGETIKVKFEVSGGSGDYDVSADVLVGYDGKLCEGKREYLTPTGKVYTFEYTPEVGKDAKILLTAQDSSGKIAERTVWVQMNGFPVLDTTPTLKLMPTAASINLGQPVEVTYVYDGVVGEQTLALDGHWCVYSGGSWLIADEVHINIPASGTGKLTFTPTFGEKVQFCVIGFGNGYFSDTNTACNTREIAINGAPWIPDLTMKLGNVSTSIKASDTLKIPYTITGGVAPYYVWVDWYGETSDGVSYTDYGSDYLGTASSGTFVCPAMHAGKWYYEFSVMDADGRKMDVDVPTIEVKEDVAPLTVTLSSVPRTVASYEDVEVKYSVSGGSGKYTVEADWNGYRATYAYDAAGVIRFPLDTIPQEDRTPYIRLCLYVTDSEGRCVTTKEQEIILLDEAKSKYDEYYVECSVPETVQVSVPVSINYTYKGSADFADFVSVDCRIVSEDFEHEEFFTLTEPSGTITFTPKTGESYQLSIRFDLEEALRYPAMKVLPAPAPEKLTYAKLAIESANLRVSPGGTVAMRWENPDQLLLVTGGAVKVGNYEWCPVVLNGEVYYVRKDMITLREVTVAEREIAYADVYDYTFYTTKYPEVAADCLGNRTAVFNHFLTTGMAAGHQAHQNFNVAYYRANYADLQAAFGADLALYYQHYQSNGKAEKRVADKLLAGNTVEPETATYVCLKGASANLRVSPGGTVALRWENKGEELPVMGDAVAKEGYQWYPVLYDGTLYYVRSDTVNTNEVPVAEREKIYSAVYNYDYYMTNHADKVGYQGSRAAALSHFINHGMADGLQANADFNVKYYRGNYPDLQAAFGDDLALYYSHYQTHGKAEGRIANKEIAVTTPDTPASATGEYVRLNGTSANLRLTPGGTVALRWDEPDELLVVMGAKVENNGSAWYPVMYKGKVYYVRSDTVTLLKINHAEREAAYAAVYDYNFYTSKYPDAVKDFLGNRAAVLDYFVNVGMKQGQQGVSSFNVDYYRANYADLQNAFGSDLPAYYMHYINNGRGENRVADKQLGNQPVQPEVDVSKSEAYYAPVYNYDYYVFRNPDVAAAFGGDRAATLKHFINHGMSEGRQGNEAFNVQIYRARYADLQAAFGSDLKEYYRHYINNGKAEGRTAK